MKSPVSESKKYGRPYSEEILSVIDLEPGKGLRFENHKHIVHPSSPNKVQCRLQLTIREFATRSGTRVITRHRGIDNEDLFVFKRQ